MIWPRPTATSYSRCHMVGVNAGSRSFHGQCEPSILVVRLELITFHDVRVTELSIADALNEHAMKYKIYPYVIKNDVSLLL